MESRKNNIYTMVLIGVMAAVICILGPLSIPLPISPVPISLTNLAIYVTVFVLGWKKGTITYGIYLLIGLIGVPVFSGFTSGFGKLAGPTGGYLIGFIFMAIMSGIFIEKFDGKIFYQVIGLVLGTIIAYLFGTMWLAHLTENTFVAALSIGVIPFIIGDIIKIIIASIAGPMIRKQLKRAKLI